MTKLYRLPLSGACTYISPAWARQGWRMRDSGRAEAYGSRNGDPHMTARPQLGFNLIGLISHFVSFLALPDGRVPATAHTKLIQGWFPAGLPV